MQDDTKGKKRGRVVPIHDWVFPRFQARYKRQRHRGPCVFPARVLVWDPIKKRLKRQTDYHKPKAHNRRHWETCKRNAGVEARWHDLRHTAATWYVRAGAQLPTLSRKLGMSVKVLIEIYNKVQTEDLWGVSRKVPCPVVRQSKVTAPRTERTGVGIAAVTQRVRVRA
jgi:integrase